MQCMQEGESWRVGNEKTGPNKARHVVQASGDFFFSFFILFDNNQHFIDIDG